jgi:3',5'-cyclic AMP phosphodiesterase CpdA
MFLMKQSNSMASRICWIALLAATIIGRGAAAQKTEKPFFFFLLSDPQLGMYTGNKGFEQESKNLNTVITAANKLHPAFVVVCGDLVNKTGDRAQIDGYLQIVGKLDPRIPLYNVAGNHDVGDAPTPALLTSYRKTFGPDYYSFHVNDLEGIILDSQLISNSSEAPSEAHKQEVWLKTTLAQARAQHVVVFQHIPWFLKSPDEKTSYYSPTELIVIPRTVRLQYLKLFHKSGIHYLFSGHYHRNAQGSYKDIQMIDIGPVGRPLGKDPSGFEIVVVKKTGLEYSYTPLVSIPEKVGLDEAQ